MRMAIVTFPLCSFLPSSQLARSEVLAVFINLKGWLWQGAEPLGSHDPLVSTLAPFLSQNVPLLWQKMETGFPNSQLVPDS